MTDTNELLAALERDGFLRVVERPEYSVERSPHGGYVVTENGRSIAWCKTRAAAVALRDWWKSNV